MDKKVKKNKRTRLLFQAAWTALTNGYLYGFISGKIYTGKTKDFCVPGLSCYSCPGALGSCPIGALQAQLNSPLSKVPFYALGILIFFGSVFGRFVCGWLCPFGLIQDLLYKIPLFKKKKTLPGHHILRWLKYAVLVLIVIVLPILDTDDAGTGKPYFCEYICPSGTLFGGIPLVTDNSGLRDSIGGRFWWKIGLLIIVLGACIKVYRPFCKYMCPLGACYSLFNPVAIYRYKLNKDKCTGCGACASICKMGVDPCKNVNSPECIRCGDCLKGCPANAIEKYNPIKGLAKENSHE